MESGAGIVIMLVYFALIIVMIVANWMLNEKAGEPGWACLVPIYNVIVLGRMAGLTTLWIVLLFVPCATSSPCSCSTSNSRSVSAKTRASA